MALLDFAHVGLRYSGTAASCTPPHRFFGHRDEGVVLVFTTRLDHDAFMALVNSHSDSLFVTQLITIQYSS